MLGDLTVYAVDRFWRTAKASNGAARAELALSAFLDDPHAVSSKAWAALLLHTASMGRTLIAAVLDCLACWKSGAPPPASLARRVGFVQHGDRTQTVCEVVDQPALDPRKVLAALRAVDLLNHQAVAEIVLAVAGNKMSRITGHSTLLAQVARVVGFPFFIGSQSVEPINDTTLEGFSNRSAPGERIQDLAGDCDVYSYFGGDAGDQALLSVLDQLNMAGAYLGIPPCCRAFFAASWDTACRDHDGDLAFLFMSSQPQWTDKRLIDIAWQCNPYGMYAGGGLTWHFPCSPTCAATIDTVDERFGRLSEIDATFARECRAFQQRSFTLLPDRTTVSESDASSGVLIQPFARSES